MGLITAVAAASTAKSSGSSLTFPLLIGLVFIGFYFLLIRPQRRRQQATARQQNTVAPGAQVRTTAGMYATVIEVDDNDVVLEIAPGVEVRYLKRSIMEVISPGDVPDTEFADSESFSHDEVDDENTGTSEDSGDVESAEEGLVDAHDERAADKDNVH